MTVQINDKINNYTRVKPKQIHIFSASPSQTRNAHKTDRKTETATGEEGRKQQQQTKSESQSWRSVNRGPQNSLPELL